MIKSYFYPKSRNISHNLSYVVVMITFSTLFASGDLQTVWTQIRTDILSGSNQFDTLIVFMKSYVENIPHKKNSMPS